MYERARQEARNGVTIKLSTVEIFFHIFYGFAGTFAGNRIFRFSVEGLSRLLSRAWRTYEKIYASYFELVHAIYRKVIKVGEDRSDFPLPKIAVFVYFS